MLSHNSPLLHYPHHEPTRTYSCHNMHSQLALIVPKLALKLKFSPKIPGGTCLMKRTMEEAKKLMLFPMQTPLTHVGKR